MAFVVSAYVEEEASLWHATGSADIGRGFEFLFSLCAAIA